MFRLRYPTIVRPSLTPHKGTVLHLRDETNLSIKRSDESFAGILSGGGRFTTRVVVFDPERRVRFRGLIVTITTRNAREHRAAGNWVRISWNDAAAGPLTRSPIRSSGRAAVLIILRGSTGLYGHRGWRGGGCVIKRFLSMACSRGKSHALRKRTGENRASPETGQKEPKKPRGGWS